MVAVVVAGAAAADTRTLHDVVGACAGYTPRVAAGVDNTHNTDALDSAVVEGAHIPQEGTSLYSPATFHQRPGRQPRPVQVLRHRWMQGVKRGRGI